jgi:hypothetical protein
MKRAWSTKRTVAQAVRVITSLGYDRFEDIEIRGYTVAGASTYVELRPLGLTIRVSDHSQPFAGKWGGYDVTRGERHSAADFSISPEERTVSDLRWWLLEMIALDNLPYLYRPEDALEFGHA